MYKENKLFIYVLVAWHIIYCPQTHFEFYNCKFCCCGQVNPLLFFFFALIRHMPTCMLYVGTVRLVS